MGSEYGKVHSENATSQMLDRIPNIPQVLRQGCKYAQVTQGSEKKRSIIDVW